MSQEERKTKNEIDGDWNFSKGYSLTDVEKSAILGRRAKILAEERQRSSNFIKSPAVRRGKVYTKNRNIKIWS